ncbi:MAG: tetratricopeptide repeat protein [Candidatus Babeliales bacterium]
MKKNKVITLKKTLSPTTNKLNQREIHWSEWLIPPFLLSFITGLFYYPSLHYNFQFDDVANIQKFYNIRYLTLKDAWLTSSRWIPFWLNAVNHRLGQFDPFYYRLFNISFHIAAGILLFFIILFILSNLKSNSFFKQHCTAIAYLTTGLFLLHPVQTQTVSYVIQGRMEGLATLFILSMILCFLAITRVKNKIFKILLILLLFCIAFVGCGTKEIVIVAPLLILAIDWFFVAQGDWPSLKQRLLLHGFLSGIIFCSYLYFLKPSFFANIFGLKMEARNNIGNLLTEIPGQKILPLHFFISQFKVILHYIVMFIWPFMISVEYDWKLVSNFFAPDCILPLCALLLISAILIYRLRKNCIDPIVFAALWFFIAIAPRSTIIPSSELLVDYKTYLASFGILFLMASFIIKLLSELIPKIIKPIPFISHAFAQFVFITILAVPTGFLTYSRNKVWRSAEEFWSNIIENAPGKARAYNNLGVALSEKGRMQEAIPLYKKAISMDKNYPDPCNNLAVAYSMTGKMNLAIDTLKKAIQMHPYYPEAYNNLASFYITQKDFDRAVKILDIAIQLRPHYGKAYYNLGKLYVEKGNYEKAFECFKTACTKADLDNEAGFGVYASIAMHLRKFEDAIIAYSHLVRIAPHSIDYAYKLANSYLGCSKYINAAQIYEEILKKEQKNPQVWCNLGECNLFMKKPDKALKCFSQAQALKMSSPQLTLRIITCLEQMGELSIAKFQLEDFIKDNSTPDQLKFAAKSTLDRINTKEQNKNHA